VALSHLSGSAPTLVNTQDSDQRERCHDHELRSSASSTACRAQAGPRPALHAHGRDRFGGFGDGRRCRLGAARLECCLDVVYDHWLVVGRGGFGHDLVVGGRLEPVVRMTRRASRHPAARQIRAAASYKRRHRKAGTTRFQVVPDEYRHGTWLSPGQAIDLRLSRRSLKLFGATPAAGVLAALPVDRCGLAETARVVDYLVHESAGQCGPCRNGLASIAGAVRKLAEHGAPARIRTNVERWAGVVAGRGACKHPDGTVLFVGSALLVFADEITLHQAGHCTATSREPFLPVPGGAPLQESDWR
jgi:hypothetical protein